MVNNKLNKVNTFYLGITKYFIQNKLKSSLIFKNNRKVSICPRIKIIHIINFYI